MMSKETFELLDEVFQHKRKSKKLFGGVQLILLGDFGQLKPVSGDYIFLSEKFMDLDFYIELKTIFRQKDIYWINILREIRNGKLSEESIKSLKERIKKPKDNNYITIYSTNKEVDNVNNQELKKLDGKEYEFNAVEGFYIFKI